MKEKEKEIKRQEKLKKHLKRGIGGLKPNIENVIINPNSSGSPASATAISSAQARSELTSAIKDSTGASSGSRISSFATDKKATVPAGDDKVLKLGTKSMANEDAFLQQLRYKGEKMGIGLEKVFKCFKMIKNPGNNTNFCWAHKQ